MVQGRGINSSLNATGKKQARCTFEALQPIPIEKIFTSNLKRTAETVEAFNQPKTSHTGFDEISWGNQEGVVPSEDARNLYSRTIKNWRAGLLHQSLGGGETPIDVMDRQKEAMQAVLDHDSRHILVCMHGRAMRILLCWVLGYSLRHMDGFPHENCSIYQLVWTGKKFHVRWFNYTDHLPILE